jgi:hypothetical protein
MRNWVFAGLVRQGTRDGPSLAVVTEARELRKANLQKSSSKNQGK